MPKLTLRIDFDADRAIGPGKVKLLEMIDNSRLPHREQTSRSRQSGTVVSAP
jgi:hypothetical protein